MAPYASRLTGQTSSGRFIKRFPAPSGRTIGSRSRSYANSAARWVQLVSLPGMENELSTNVCPTWFSGLRDADTGGVFLPLTERLNYPGKSIGQPNGSLSALI